MSFNSRYGTHFSASEAETNAQFVRAKSCLRVRCVRKKDQSDADLFSSARGAKERERERDRERVTLLFPKQRSGTQSNSIANEEEEEEEEEEYKLFQDKRSSPRKNTEYIIKKESSKTSAPLSRTHLTRTVHHLEVHLSVGILSINTMPLSLSREKKNKKSPTKN